MSQADDFEIRFTAREITVWGGLALMRRMLQSIRFSEVAKEWDLPQPGSNRGYEPVQIIEQFLVSIWCGANRFAHAEITRFDTTLTRLFGWTRVAGHKAIMHFFNRFDMAMNEQVQEQIYRWFFDRLSIDRLTMDVDSTVITRCGQQQGATTPASLEETHIIPCWPSSLNRAWWQTFGCVRVTPTVQTTSWLSLKPRCVIWVARRLGYCAQTAAFSMKLS
jgi:hypothetical protein